MQVVILAGGRGKRMRPMTDTTPKTLLCVNGTPFARLQLQLLKEGGASSVLYLLGYRGQQVHDYVVQAGHELRLAISTLVSPDRGTGAALMTAHHLGLLHREFVLTYGDSYLTNTSPWTAIDFLHRFAPTPIAMSLWHGADNGMMAMRREVVDNLDCADLNDFLGRVDHYDYPVSHKWQEIGSPEGLRELELDLRCL
jgi:NDP-sugar pyrophosphorylase family protein